MVNESVTHQKNWCCSNVSLEGSKEWYVLDIKLINLFTKSFIIFKKSDLEVLLKHVEEFQEGTAEERECIFRKFSF